ncbi:MAG: hypothetical protein AAB522_02170 [Patescibacteria group bacterium]
MRITQTVLYVFAVIAMISLVAFIKNDYILAAIYSGVIVVSIMLKKEKTDLLFLTIGFFGSMIGEYFFINTGVETFSRTTLFGIMPLWLPFLWAFIFLAAKRVFWILVKKNL